MNTTPSTVSSSVSDFDPLNDILALASVPEHSARFMESASGGKCFRKAGFVFYAANDWLMGIGYPLEAVEHIAQSPQWLENNAAAFGLALDEALEATGATSCWAIAPQLPERFIPYVENSDDFYLLPADATVPTGLRGQVARAAEQLRVTEDRDFTPEHRRLWAEFLGRVTMRPNVRELYARTAASLAAAKKAHDAGDGGSLDLRLLSAWDASGKLAASLLLDYSAKDFCSYIIGAHSREAYAPHATDLLFSVMLEHSRAEGKRFVHLGLGVNDGIARFKRKWGGKIAMPYQMAAWKEKERHTPVDARKDISQALEAILSTPPGISKQQLFDTFPKQRTFGMIREVRKGNAVSYLCGTAHFFCYSFEMCFRDLFEPLDTIIFEGPLDEDFLSAVEKTGRHPEKDDPRVIDTLNEDEIRTLERVVYGPEGFWPKLFGLQHERRVDVRHLLADTRPWFAFFTLWVAFLERQGWSQSVDLEAWHTARDMGKAIVGMENLEEQIDSLEVVPLQRITSFLRNSPLWPSYMKRNISAYLSGDLDRMLGSSIEFPSRTEMVIDRRDERFRQRMRPFIEAGNCAVFVGSAHLIGLTTMLEEDGFSVRPVELGLWKKICARGKNIFGA